jgi:ABC-type antimicrobial peptide transport system permease subunit
MAYSVVQRRGELGVRLALGAPPRTLLLLVMRRALKLGVLGLVAAVPLAWLGGSAMRSVLYGVSPFNPEALGAAAAVMLFVALGAAVIPALRASRLEPLAALRHEQNW